MIISFTNCTGTIHQKKVLKDTMPNFNMENIDGKTIFNTQTIPEGDPIVFFYFGAFCEPSRIQMKNIIKDIDELKNIKFYLFTGDSLYDVMLFYNHFQLSKYPNITVFRDPNFKLIDYLHFNGTPALAFYNKNKILRSTIRESIYGRQIKRATEGN